jgi:hypothetical protein
MGLRSDIGTVEEKKSYNGGYRTRAVQPVAIPVELSRSRNLPFELSFRAAAEIATTKINVL